MTSISAAQDPAPGKGRLCQACHPVLSTSATSVWRANRLLHVKPERHELSFCQHSLRVALVCCTDRAVGVRNSNPRNPLLPVRNTGIKRSSHAVFGGRLKSSPTDTTGTRRERQDATLTRRPHNDGLLRFSSAVALPAVRQGASLGADTDVPRKAVREPRYTHRRPVTVGVRRRGRGRGRGYCKNGPRR